MALLSVSPGAVRLSGLRASPGAVRLLGLVRFVVPFVITVARRHRAEPEINPRFIREIPREPR
ncbi:hypothetical protein AMK12_26890 [Streptomyces sp. TSRI0395]|nr:hypothetical protein AMK12_26890 [Streptomyces sp. TSRI0395]